jgi:cystathionine beta-lyase
VLSFETGSVEASKVIVEETQLFKITVSFGNVTSQISLPCYMSHASIPAEVRAARGLPDDLVRISTGIEHADDLLADLDQAMQQAMGVAGVSPSSSLAAGGGGDREQQLMHRIRELEAQLASKS